MTYVRRSAGKGNPLRMPDAAISQANPVSGTEYEVLATSGEITILSMMAKVTWTAQPTPLELHVYVDGQVITHTQGNPATATEYYAEISPVGTEAQQIFSATVEWGMLFRLRGKSIRVTAETTGGTVSNLSARIKYEQG